jgi:hypothetical protein
LLQLRTIAGGTNHPPPRGWKVFFGKLKQYQIFLLIALGTCVMIAAGFVLARARPVDANEWRREIILAAQMVVRNAVREEIRTSFASMEETQFEELPDGKYQLGGWVDLISDEGQITRQHFSCTLFRNMNDDWVSQDVSVTPQ